MSSRCVRQIAAGLHQRLGELTAVIQRLLQEEIPELARDAQSIELLGASVGGNVDTVLHAMRYEIAVQRVEAPTAAMEYARRLAQHGVPVHGLVRAYRVGQRRMNELVFAEVQATDMEPMVRLAVLEKMSATMFEYIDWMSQQVVEVYEEERERWLENQNSLRALRVREILAAKTPVDVDAASSTDSLSAALASSGGGGLVPRRRQRRQRTAPAATFPARNGPGRRGRRRAHCSWPPTPCAAGDGCPSAPPHPKQSTRPASSRPPMRTRPVWESARWRRVSADSDDRIAERWPRGRWGPRASHTSRLWSPRTIPVCWWPPCSAGTSAQAREWVAEVLGDLAVDNENDARLRETLLVFLSGDGSYKLAAERLNLHSNTVKYRVGRAVARRGRAIGADRLDVELALLLCHWYGSAVTQQRPG